MYGWTTYLYLNLIFANIAILSNTITLFNLGQLFTKNYPNLREKSLI